MYVRALVALSLVLALITPAVRAQESTTSRDTVQYRCAGIGIAHGQQGDLCYSLWSYMRYLNQKGLHDSYTDAFGRTSRVKQRQDIQNNKINMGVRGWIFDPRLRYSAFAWTANTSQGDADQVAVGGFLFFDANARLTIAAGAGSLPSTRTTQGTFPNWLKVDSRTIADEFFRASYTTAVWATGSVVDGLKYTAMLGNNLSGFGVDAAELDNQLNTYGLALWWMPTTKEYGPVEGYGDFEHHDHVATLLGLHFTGSREDAQSQPGTEDIENTQIRLSDGTDIFAVGAFADSTQIRRATYHMLAADGGVKYRGNSIDAEYFARWVGDFRSIGVRQIPVSSLFDQGVQLQLSRILAPRTLQAYFAGSQIFGQYGKPWDLSAGINFFPFHERHFRLNAQALQLYRSPVGYSALPNPLGGTGIVFTLDAELFY